MNEKAKKSTSGTAKKNLAGDGMSKEEKQKAREKLKMHRILVKSTNGKSFYTYSTAGNAKQEVVISCFADPFTSAVWNKDNVRKITKDNPFQKRYGSFDFSTKSDKKEDSTAE